MAYHGPMPERIETVTIVNKDAPSGKTNIRKSEYDPKKHVLFGAKPAKKGAK